MLVLVTGSSRGFGEAIMKKFKSLHPEAFILGLCRSPQTSNEVHCDQSLARSYQTAIKRSRTLLVESDIDLQKLTHIILVQNAGTIGPIKNQFKDIADIPQVTRDYMEVNFTSFACLAGHFLSEFSDLTGALKTIVNISSLVAVEAFPTLGLYGAGKAARDQLIKALAKEHEDVKFLNYAPGPLDTAMYDSIVADSGDIHIKTLFREQKEGGNILTPEASATTLVGLVCRTGTCEAAIDYEWGSGDHLDYYDVVKQ